MFGGAWLVVTLFDQAGGASSVSTHLLDRPDRRGFDRAFVLGYFDKIVKEIPSTPARR